MVKYHFKEDKLVKGKNERIRVFDIDGVLDTIDEIWDCDIIYQHPYIQVVLDHPITMWEEGSIAEEFGDKLLSAYVSKNKLNITLKE